MKVDITDIDDDNSELCSRMELFLKNINNNKKEKTHSLPNKKFF